VQFIQILIGIGRCSPSTGAPRSEDYPWESALGPAIPGSRSIGRATETRTNNLKIM
jgi:hypothetical protein